MALGQILVSRMEVEDHVNVQGNLQITEDPRVCRDAVGGQTMGLPTVVIATGASER